MLILVRHGRTPANAAGLLQGRLDQPLDEVGVLQAGRTARHVVDSIGGEITAVYASPLLRARQTAEMFEREVIVDERWIELAYGDLEGVRGSDVPAETWQQWRSDPEFVPAGGESLADVDRRVHTACEELAELATDRHVVVVSHVSPIKSAVAWALGAPSAVTWRMHLSVAATSRIAIRDHGPVLVSFNEEPAP